MKIAVVFPYYAHYREPIIRELSKEGNHKFSFYGGTNVSPQFKGMKLMMMNSYNFVKTDNYWFLRYFSIQPGLLSAIKMGQFDAIIIFADWKYLSTWQVVLHFRRKRTPVIFWSHAFRENKFSINSIIKRVYFRLFNGGLVFDNRAKTLLEKYGINNVDVVYNSLDFGKQIEILNKVRTLDGPLQNSMRPYVVFSGRLSLTKNLNILIEAIYILKKKDVSVNLVLIGDGADRSRLESKVKSLGLSNQVLFWGSCYNENVIAQLISDALVSVIPSAVGLSAIHALTYGCPVITDDNFVKHGPEIESVIEGYSGLYYKYNSPDDLANKIQYFANMSKSDRISFSANCQNIIKEKYNAPFQKRVIENHIHKHFQYD